MSNFNPDYPTMSNGGFLQHTYRNEPTMNDMFYYNGGAVCPFGSQSLADSRRNTNPGFGAYPVPNQITPNFGQTPTNVPMNAGTPSTPVMPFSTYPPSTPVNSVGGSTLPGFNALVESRRNNFGAPVTQNNPWATTQPTQATAANAMNVPQFNNNNQNIMSTSNNVFANPYLNPQTSGYGYTIEPSSSALYGDASLIGFDRKSGCWDNMYTNTRTMPTPYVDWNAQQQQNLNPTGCMPGYQMAYPKMNKSWAEIAEQNWSGSSL